MEEIAMSVVTAVVGLVVVLVGVLYIYASFVRFTPQPISRNDTVDIVMMVSGFVVVLLGVTLLLTAARVVGAI